MRKQSFASLSLLLIPLYAGAASYSTDKLDITISDSSFQYFSRPDLDPVSYTILPDGVMFTMNVTIGGGDIEYPVEKELAFTIDRLAFAPKPGYQITGYELAIRGNVATTGQAYAYVFSGFESSNEDIKHFGGDNDGGHYAAISTRSTDNPAGGPLRAGGSLNTYAPYYYEYVYDDDGNIIDKIVLASGRADISLESVSVRALFVTPVPEPEMYLMFLAGLGAVAWRVRRNVRSSAMA